MSLPVKYILGILADNVKHRNSVIPVSTSCVSSWTRGLDIPFAGETVLYTGQMYQIIPAINALSAMLAGFESSWINNLIGIGRQVNRVVDLTRFMTWGTSKEQKRYDLILRKIALTLKSAGINFGYLYSKEMYSGALVFDEGIDDVFRDHARRVYNNFKENGVKQVITVDPHTTSILKDVYPRVVDDYDIGVKSYLEVLAEKKIPCQHHLDLDLVIHDSCVYARYEDIIEQPRSLLQSAGATIHLPELSGRLTHCCGGPLESLFPSRSHELAKKRVNQLAECGKNVVTMCPICLASLRRASNNSIEVHDIAEHLYNSYCQPELLDNSI